MRDRAGCTELGNFVAAEAKFFQHLIVVLADVRRPPGGNFGDIVDMDGTADCKLKIPSGALDWDDDSIRLKLGISEREQYRM
jgi:hypothetical protein